MDGRRLRLLTLMPAAIALNVVMGQVVAMTRLPLYLDSVGTVLVAALAGPAAGALTGLLGTVLWALTSPPTLPFALVAAVIGAAAGVLSHLGCFRAWPAAFLGGLATGCLSAVVAAPVVAIVFHGATGGGTDLLVALFRLRGASLLYSVLAQSLAVDPLDKAVSFLLVFAVLRALPLRYRQRWT